MDRSINVQMELLPILRVFFPIKTTIMLPSETLQNQGRGTADFTMPLGSWFVCAAIIKVDRIKPQKSFKALSIKNIGFFLNQDTVIESAAFRKNPGFSVGSFKNPDFEAFQAH